MDLRAIKTFVRVAELESFTRAAEELNYVQSTATMQVKQLEHELGRPLFDRMGKKVSLTAFGREYLSYAYELLHLVEKGERLGKEDAPLRGLLRVGVSESLMVSVLTGLLPAFKARFPGVSMRFKTGHIVELVGQLKRNELDLLYISANLNTDPDLCCHYRRAERIVFLAGPGHPLAGRTSIPFPELMEEEFLVTEYEGVCNGRLRELAAHHGAVLRTAMEVDSAYAVTELIKRGMNSVVFLPECYVAEHLAAGQLAELDVDVEPQTYYSQIFTHRSRWVAPYMEEFIKAVKEHRPEG